MKIAANSIRANNILAYNNGLWVVSKTPEHTKPGKGGAYVQVEMKNLKTGAKIQERFSSSDYVEKAELEQRNFLFSYCAGDEVVFMDMENYEPLHVKQEVLGSKLPFLQESMQVEVEFYDGTPLNIKLPQTVILEIKETDPIIKGATATASYKPAILSNMVKVMVPQYLKIGDRIVIKTEDNSFVERAK